jgi:hypothetical protein
MGGLVRFAVKKDGRIWTGSGDRSFVRLGGWFALQSGDPKALEALFGCGGGRALLDVGLGPYSLVPVGYGIVCVDIDAKTVDSHQSYQKVGVLKWDVLDGVKLGLIPNHNGTSKFSEANLCVEAYMGGGLGKRLASGVYEGLACSAATKSEAAKELVSRYDGKPRDVGDPFRMLAPGWTSKDWMNDDFSLEPMARCLAARGWAFPVETIGSWRTFAEKRYGRSEAEKFDGWYESARESAELEAVAAVMSEGSKSAGLRL